jgi:hypothetical protein
MGREVVRLRQQLDHLENSQRYHLSLPFFGGKEKAANCCAKRKDYVIITNLFHSKDVG